MQAGIWNATQGTRDRGCLWGGHSGSVMGGECPVYSTSLLMTIELFTNVVKIKKLCFW